MGTSPRRSPALATLAARYPDLETRNFLGRVRSALSRADREGNRDICEAIRDRVRGLRPSAFRIVPGPHEGWADHVALVYAYLITRDGLPSRDAVAGFVQLWWELDSSETHELALVMVDSDGHETPFAMADLALSYDSVHARDD